MSRQEEMGVQFVAPRRIAVDVQVDVDGDPDIPLRARVDIGPLRVGQIVALLGTINSLVSEVSSAPPAVLLAFMSAGQPGRTLADDMAVVAWLMDLLQRRANDMLRIVEVSADMDRRTIDGLLPDRLVALMIAILEVNADFFGQCAPLLRQLAARPGPPWNQGEVTATGGPTPSSSLSPTATDTPTS